MEPRTAIRYAARDWLRERDDGTHPTDVGADIYASRLLPVSPQERDVIAIYTFNEQIDPDHGYQPGGINRRLLTLMIEIVAGGDEADDVIDTLAGQVERRLTEDPQLGQRIETIALDELDIGRPAEDDRLLVARQSWQLTYYTAPSETEGDVPTDVFINPFPPFGESDQYKQVLGLE